MAFDRVSLTGLERFIDGMSFRDLDPLTAPETDPARQMPALPQDAMLKVDPGVPAVEEIEAALVEHVRGGPSPRDLIAKLFAPFVDARFIELEPGKGQKRPSYAICISPHGLTLPRASTADIAEELHRIGALLTRYAIGDRAPDGSADLLLFAPMSGEYPMTLPVRASSIATARAAYFAAFRRMPDAVSVPLSLGADDILPHIAAARHLLAEGAAGTPALRRQAVALIAAAEDLRTVASVILRRHPELSSFSRLSIEIALDEGFTLNVVEDHVERGSAHAEMQFQARHRDLFDALRRTAQRHEVLRQLPDSCALRMSGTPSFLQFALVNEREPRYAPGHTISALDYNEVGTLVEQLSKLDIAGRREQAHWRLILSKGRYRSKRVWELHGETLAQALARSAEADRISPSMALIDLAIDLCADEDGNPSSVEIHRVL